MRPRRTRPPRIAWHLASCCLIAAFAAGSARGAEEAPEAGSHVVEWFGLEFSPLGMGINDHMQDGPIRLGACLTLRAPTRRKGDFLWTTFESGGGYFPHPITTFLGFGGTRIGWLVLEEDGMELSLGLGIGAGGLGTEHVYHGDTGGMEGGVIAFLWPTLQIAFQATDHCTLGTTVRLFLPLVPAFSYAAQLNVALDVGFR